MKKEWVRQIQTKSNKQTQKYKTAEIKTKTEKNLKKQSLNVESKGLGKKTKKNKFKCWK